MNFPLLSDSILKSSSPPPSTTMLADEQQECFYHRHSPACVVHDTTALQQSEKDRIIFKSFPNHLYLPSEDFKKNNTTSSSEENISAVPPRLSLKPRTTAFRSNVYDSSTPNLPHTKKESTQTQYLEQQGAIKRSMAFSEDFDDDVANEEKNNETIGSSNNAPPSSETCYNFEKFHSTLLAIDDEDDDWPTDETSSDDVTSLFTEDSILSPIDGLYSPPRSSTSSCYYESSFCQDSIAITKRKLSMVKQPERSSSPTQLRPSSHSPTNVFLPINGIDEYYDSDNEDCCNVATTLSQRQGQPIVVFPKAMI